MKLESPFFTFESEGSAAWPFAVLMFTIFCFFGSCTTACVSENRVLIERAKAEAKCRCGEK